MKPHQVDAKTRGEMLPLAVILAAIFGCAVGAVIAAPIIAKVLP